MSTKKRREPALRVAGDKASTDAPWLQQDDGSAEEGDTELVSGTVADDVMAGKDDEARA